MSGGWDTILFDLDGTLTDPKVGITTASALALAHFGIHEEAENLTKFIGPPLDETFTEDYGFTPEQCVEATEVFRAYYVERGWLENVPYEGIEPLLKKLRQAGKRLLVATTKPEATAERILKHFGLAAYFDLICGATPGDQKGARKVMVIRDALRRMNIQEPSRAVMVGDRRHDVEGAHGAGLPAIGVLYGYGGREELVRSGADALAADPDELYTILMREER